MNARCKHVPARRPGRRNSENQNLRRTDRYPHRAFDESRRARRHASHTQRPAPAPCLALSLWMLSPDPIPLHHQKKIRIAIKPRPKYARLRCLLPIWRASSVHLTRGIQVGGIDGVILQKPLAAVHSSVSQTRPLPGYDLGLPIVDCSGSSGSANQVALRTGSPAGSEDRCSRSRMPGRLPPSSSLTRNPSPASLYAGLLALVTVPEPRWPFATQSDPLLARAC